MPLVRSDDVGRERTLSSIYATCIMDECIGRYQTTSRQPKAEHGRRLEYTNTPTVLSAHPLSIELKRTQEPQNPLSMPRAAIPSPAAKLPTSLPSTLWRTPAPVEVVVAEADVEWDVAEWEVAFAPDEVAEDEVTEMEVVAKLMDVL